MPKELISSIATDPAEILANFMPALVIDAPSRGGYGIYTSIGDTDGGRAN